MRVTPDEYETLIKGLCNPAAFPHPVNDVELLQTHISWVLLAGEFAYKLKKPVNLGFVDFSTRERREFFCHEEVRLNRRLAESLYLGVVPIEGTLDFPRIGDPGSTRSNTTSAMEFAVKMRRFPAHAELVSVLQRGELTREHIEDLAHSVAQFHATIDIAKPETRWGSPSEVVRPVRENFRYLRSDVASTDQRKSVAALETWSEQEFQRCQEVFTRRKQGGFIRECHGDMHLGNMLLENGHVLIFDCLEFNESLRWVDVQSEIAFLTMDLEDRGRRDFANCVLNSYLESTGDYEGSVLLPFYQTYRAVVRAKVASLRARQADSDKTEREQCLQEEIGYLDLALRYTHPPTPTLFVTHGLSGSGKTHATQTVIEDWNSVRLRSDVERKRLVGLSATESSRSEIGAGLYSADLTHRTYERLKELAGGMLKSGRSVIIDATNLRRVQRAMFRDLAQQLGIRHLVLEFTAPTSVLRDRVQQRHQSGNDASEATLAVLDQQFKEIEPLDEAERLDTISIDTSAADVQSNLRDALKSRRNA